VKLAKDSWEPCELSLDDFVHKVTKRGSAFAAQFKDGIRRNDNYLQTSVFALDFDGKLRLAYALAHPFILSQAAFVYNTPSHIPGVEDRFRVVFVTEEPVTDSLRYREIINGLLDRFPHADQTCKDPARFFYGNKDASVVRAYGNYYQPAC